MKTETKLPTFTQYKSIVDEMVDSKTLTVEQSIILLQCFKARLRNDLVHLNYLIQCTGLTYKEICWTLNGLVLQGAIKRVDKKYYTV